MDTPFHLHFLNGCRGCFLSLYRISHKTAPNFNSRHSIEYFIETSAIAQSCPL